MIGVVSCVLTAFLLRSALAAYGGCINPCLPPPLTGSFEGEVTVMNGVSTGTIYVLGDNATMSGITVKVAGTPASTFKGIATYSGVITTTNQFVVNTVPGNTSNRISTYEGRSNVDFNFAPFTYAAINPNDGFTFSYTGPVKFTIPPGDDSEQELLFNNLLTLIPGTRFLGPMKGRGSGSGAVSNLSVMCPLNSAPCFSPTIVGSFLGEATLTDSISTGPVVLEGAEIIIAGTVTSSSTVTPTIEVITTATGLITNTDRLTIFPNPGNTSTKIGIFKEANFGNDKSDDTPVILYPQDPKNTFTFTFNGPIKVTLPRQENVEVTNDLSNSGSISLKPNTRFFGPITGTGTGVGNITNVKVQRQIRSTDELC